MKKFFLMMLASVLFVACSDDKDEPAGLQIDQLVGQWVYDHPEEGIWETQKFLPSGVFYYWNKTKDFQNTANDGRWWIEDNNKVTCQYSVNGVSTQIKMTVRQISDYSYTAEYNDGAAIGVFTYARLLDTIQLIPGESTTPDYSVLVKIAIQGFKSHNTSVAIVDPSSGQITGVKAGHTYVDIMTAEGTAVVEVTVFDPDDMFADYSYAFGKTIPEIVDLLGDGYEFRDDENGVVYLSDDYLADEIRFITGLYDKTHVEFVQLTLNDNVSSAAIIDHLSKRHTPLSNSEGVYNYVTTWKVNGNPVALVYDSNKSTLTYMVLRPSDRWTDFSYLFGQTDNVVSSEMQEWGYAYVFSDYGYSKDGSDYYAINDSNDATLVGFVFNGEKKMCEYWVYLHEDFMKDAKAILSWLKSKYTLSSSECSPSRYVFYDAGKRMRIVFDASGYVSYTDSEQTPFVPASSSSNMSTKIASFRHNDIVVKKTVRLKVRDLIYK